MRMLGSPAPEVDADVEPHPHRAQAEAWLAADPDPKTRKELQEILDRGDDGELAERFAAPLTFGTAGLRGRLGAGPGMMNRAVVIRATAGVCAALLTDDADGARRRGVVIGFDGRHGSRVFAEDAAGVCAALGIPAHVFDEVAPTPLVAFACADLKAAAGIVVTASHNPPEDNGYKVYWGNAAQIVPPVDAEIASHIDNAPGARDVPRSPPDDARAAGLWRALGDAQVKRYLDGVGRLPVHPELPRDGVSIAYTAMHGVGGRLVHAALEAGGFPRVASVPEQAEPDPDFPTVSFPNPEEPGAMDRVLDLAKSVEADLVLANDPDADRLAVAAPAGDGRYVQLTGNDLGCLLAHYLLSEGAAADGKHRIVAQSVVSSPLLGRIAHAHGARWEQTLTGFKWIANRAMELEAADPDAVFVFGYEEALGYTVGDLVRDKDGIGAALVVADMVAWCRARGTSLLGEREAMWRRYGLAKSQQVSLKLTGLEGAARIGRMMDGMRASPPKQVGGVDVEAVADLRTGRRVTVADGEETTLPFPSSDVLSYDLAGGHRVMLRPSGTEPKIKGYVDVMIEVAGDEPIADAEARARRLADQLGTGFKELVEAIP